MFWDYSNSKLEDKQDKQETWPKCNNTEKSLILGSLINQALKNATQVSK